MNPILTTEQRKNHSTIAYADPATFDSVAHVERDRALHAEFDHEPWMRLVEFFRAERASEIGRVVYGLAVHLPAYGPAIHTIALHILNEDVEGGCCGLPGWDAEGNRE